MKKLLVYLKGRLRNRNKYKSVCQIRKIKNLFDLFFLDKVVKMSINIEGFINNSVTVEM